MNQEFKPVIVDGMPRCDQCCRYCIQRTEWTVGLKPHDCRLTGNITAPLGYPCDRDGSLCEPAILARLAAAEACCAVAEEAMDSLSLSLNSEVQAWGCTITDAVEAWRKAKGE